MKLNVLKYSMCCLKMQGATGNQYTKQANEFKEFIITAVRVEPLGT
jgi:hypothetical protein